MTYSKLLLLAGLSLFSLSIFGQEGIAYDLKKPAKYENRTLASEKSGDASRKISKSRRFVQNTITHYNYWYNANVKIETVLALAKAQNREDYTRLLPFYNYSLEATAVQKKELDSVIYKCNMAILIHDTRNDWIDNLYMLMGRAYYLRKEFDSAFITFQFTNYAFAPRDKDGDPIPIGSNIGADEGTTNLNVSTPEKRNILQKTFSLPPSRNESLVWKIRVYLAKEQYAEAASLIEVLKNDPQFPARLTGELHEVQALYFYKQSVYDSAAWYLEKALPVAANREEKARWEYLIAQLYERTGNSFGAMTFYNKVVNHTYNPVLEVYARLNAIRQNKTAGQDYIQKNIDALVKMAKKDRYESYRDIIYYTAAQMELERQNRPGAEQFLRLCIKSASAANGINVRNKAFLLLANMAFEDKKYKDSKNYYDSLNLLSLAADEKDLVSARKPPLAIIVTQLQIIERQDSLMRIAAMPQAQRDAYIKKLVRYLRKQQGLREEQDSSFVPGNNFNNKDNAPNLFAAGQNGTDWYFDNPSVKSKGYSEFRNKWGNRPNIDNWQLSSLVSQQLNGGGRNGNRALPGLPGLEDKNSLPASPQAITFKSLLANLPLTPEKLKKLNDSVENALFTLGKSYQDGIADYSSAITSYEGLLDKFPDTHFREETLFGLYYCYKKIGDETNAARVLALLKQKYPTGQLTARIVNPDSTEKAAGLLKELATRQYDKVYISFIEGRFEEALAGKKTADSLYGDKYWTPQLLYIEAVYFIRTRQDNQARQILGNIQTKFARTPMAAKAATLLDVLNRRKQIEDYLTNLKITRATDDDTLAAQTAAAKPAQRPVDSVQKNPEDTIQMAKTRTRLPGISGKQPQNPAAATGMDKLAVAPGNLTQIKMDADELARVRKRADSLEAAIQKAYADSMAIVKSRRMSDSLKKATLAALQHRNDSVRAVLEKLKNDSLQLADRIHSLNSVFSFSPEKPHSVLILMDKVDPVYVSEARNAFNRFNKENYYGWPLNIENSPFNDSLKLVVINGFGNADSALQYMKRVRASAPREIVPWLPAGKYSFLLISTQNLALLLSNKDMEAYRKFFFAAYPGAKF